MNLNGYYQEYGREGLERLARQMGSSADYLSQIVHGHRQASWRFAQRLEQATDGEITRHEQRPDIFDAPGSSENKEAIRAS